MAAGAARDAHDRGDLPRRLRPSPLLQALVGFGPGPRERHHVERDLVREVDAANGARSELGAHYEAGGLVEAMVRALVYVRLAEGSVDERGFAIFSAMRKARRPRGAAASSRR